MVSLEQLYEFLKLRFPGHLFLALNGITQQQHSPTIATQYNAIYTCLVFTSVCLFVATQSNIPGSKSPKFCFLL